MARIIGLDYGERRIGVAASDPLGLTAQPVTVIDLRAAALADALPPLLEELAAERIVVGLPISLSGGEGPSAAAARRFADEVRDISGLPVELFDERFSSVTADRVLVDAGVRRERHKAVRDKLAAAVMLQAYLDHR